MNMPLPTDEVLNSTPHEPFLIRCSSLSDIMTMPRSGTGLSDTAKSRIEKDVVNQLYGFDPELHTPKILKGRMCEDEAIALLAAMNYVTYKKNTVRFNNEWLTGEPDIIHKEKYGRDTKCSWDIGTHPKTLARAFDKAKKAGYDWQVRGYMMLTELPEWWVDFLMIPTPDELIKPWDKKELYVDCVLNAPLNFRVRSVKYERDLTLEEQIKERCEMAQAYAAELKKELAA